MALMRGSIWATRRGVNARAVGERNRVCPGGSIPTMDGWGMPPDTKKTGSLRDKIDHWQSVWCGRIGLLIEEDCLDVGVARDNVITDRWRVEHGRVPDRVHDRKWIGQELGRERIEIRSNDTTL